MRKWLLLVMLVPRVALADPLALRTPAVGRDVSVVGGDPESSVAFHFGSGLGISAGLRVPLSIAAVDVGYRRLLLGKERGWSLQTAVWAGLVAQLVTKGIAVDVGLALHARVHKGLFVGALGVAMPASVQLTRQALMRLPVLAEAWLGVQAGPVTCGIQGGAGAVLLAAPSPSLLLQASLYAAVGF